MNQGQMSSRAGVTAPSGDLMHVRATNRSYYTRLLLPGLSKDINIRVDVRRDEAYVTGLVNNIDVLKEAVEKNNVDLCVEGTTGHFCLLIKLPRHVNPRCTRLSFNPAGVLDVVFANAEQPDTIMPGSNYFPFPRVD